MKLPLYCPTCSRTLTDSPITTLQVTCTACHHDYGVIYGKLSKHASIYETLVFLTKWLPGIYKRHYTLQITTADRTLKRLQFSISGKADPIPAHYGDIVSVLYTMQGYVMKKLVAVTNHTTGKRYVLPHPVPSSSFRSVTVGTVLIALLMGSCITGVNILLASVLSTLGVLIYLRMTNSAQLTNPSLETAGSEGDRLVGDQRLLAQKAKIEHRIHELSHENQSNHGLIERLEALKRKMVEFDSSLYTQRIFRATSAVNILKQQVTNTQRLIREYRRTLRMIEIEVETSWIADQLPNADNFTHAILQKLAELKTIEEQNQSLKLQLAAYEEVQHHVIQQYDA